MSKIISTVRTFVADENGVTALEYGMLAAAIAAVIAATVMAIGPKINDAFTKVLGALGGSVA
jgi:pilus assembly protein Flp/PilA